GGSALAAAFLVGLSMYGLLIEIRHRIVLISLAFWLLLAMFYVGLNIPNYHWYYAPFVYLALIAACRGLWQTLELAISKGPRLSIAAVMSVVVAFGFAYSLRHTVSFAEGGPNQDYVAIGRWLEENTPDDSSVAMVE